MAEQTQNVDDFQKKLEEQQKLVQEYTNTLRMLQADFENYIKDLKKTKQNLQIFQITNWLLNY